MGRDTKYYSKGKVKEGCSVFDLHFNMVKYFKNIEDARTLSPTTIMKVDLICPDCGSEKQMQVSNLITRGFSCNKCSDGISVPEKFVSNILAQLGLFFEPQKTFSWAKNKRYDFYIEKLIIEVHGMQHYKHTGRGRKLEEEIRNDNVKRELAIKNGISNSNYIVIDCRYSEFQWMKNNVEKELESKFDLKKVNWEIAWESSQRSLVFKVCDYWENGELDLNTTKIGKIFNISRATARLYLKIGSDLGICNYVAEDEIAKRTLQMGITSRNNNSIKVCQYTADGSFVKEYSSMSEANLETGVGMDGIVGCANGKYAISGGFLWKKLNGDFSDIQPYEKPIPKSAKTVSQYTLERELVWKFDSAHDAMRKTGFDHSQISACCRGERKSSHGFIWVYE